MEIKTQVQDAIESAYKSMSKNAYNAVYYFYRREIYYTFNLYGVSQSEMLFKRLAITSAKYVLPMWKDAQPNDTKIEKALSLAEEYLNGTVNFETINTEANLLWDFIERFDTTKEGLSFGNTFYAGMSCLEAVLEVRGKIPYEDIILEEWEDDFDVDIYVGDTVFWAANAFSGRFGAEDLNIEKNKIFWTWWLREAIPNTIASM